MHSAEPLSARTGTLYEVLGVPETADARDIKSAYRKRAMKLHPDVNPSPDARERFMECKTAYETLSDPAQRSAYDNSRRAWPGSGGGYASGNGEQFGEDWEEFKKYAKCVSRS